MAERIAVLFVCLGNICRSPLAEGIFRDVVRGLDLQSRFDIDSAGTGGWHIGSAPDPRSVDVADRHAIDLTALRARKLILEDFRRFDVILGMDDDNVADIRTLADGPAHIDQFHRFATGIPLEIDDPYFGGAEGFETAYRIIRAASGSLATKLVSGIDPRKG